MHTHTTQTKQVGVFPCRGWWRPVSALPAVSRDLRYDVKRGEAEAVAHDPLSRLPRIQAAVSTAIRLGSCRSLGDDWRLPTDEQWREMAKRYGGVRSADKGRAAFMALLSGDRSGFNAVWDGNRSAGDTHG